MSTSLSMSLHHKICFTYLNILAIGTLLFGVTYLLIGEPMPYHQVFMGVEFGEFAASQVKAADFIMLLLKFVGCGLVSASILMLGVIWYGYRARCRWAWVSLLLGVNALVIPLVAMTQYTGEKPVDTLLIIELVLFLGVMAWSYTEFFGDQSS